MTIKRIVGVCVGILVASNAHARGQYLDWWEDHYQGSQSSNSGCQLCHQNSGGGDGWNRYGWAIRTPFVGQFTTSQELITRLNSAADQLSSADVDGTMYIDEIRYHAQPGWVAGANNTIYFSNNTTTSGQPPPASFSEQEIPVDLNFDVVGDPIAGSISVGAIAVSTQQIAGGLTAPLKAVTAPGINGSIFVVEQIGQIRRIDLTDFSTSVFLDVRSSLVSLNTSGDERGLLGLAFHPNFAENGLFYTYQSEPVRAHETSAVDFTTLPNNVTPAHRTFIVEYRALNPSCNSYIAKQRNLMIINQPQNNHNGGDMSFGPDNMLYISIGDGGGLDDQGSNKPDSSFPFDGHGLLGNGRDANNVLGTILRIDVDGSNSANGQYGIPADNPFVGVPGVDEIFAYGFRNPFRMAFDRSTGTLWTGDVGQNNIEEINAVQSGGNYGWNHKEGSFFFIDFNDYGTSAADRRVAFLSTTEPPYTPQNLIDPVVEYDHQEGISVTGGSVYRGTQIPALQGQYVFADYLAGFSKRLMSFPVNDTSPLITKLAMNDLSDNVTGFGEDSAGELYFVSNPGFSPNNNNGSLNKIVAPGSEYTPPSRDGESAQCLQGEDDSFCFPLVANNAEIVTVCL